ncbi:MULTISPECIES: signal peptidase I [Paenibacillus]|uniref:Signal peptidase I n=1 Tax=Paenibacillus albilobatus TaxID=2716884 RepID=A0A919XI36_9BACL|nr:MULTISPECIES: signal peptidase I [Paenibacillus]GIO32144.1 signal peptidase I [Paenibacillus albilobatus]
MNQVRLQEHGHSENDEKAKTEAEPKKRSFAAEVWDWAKTIVIAFVIMMLLNLFVFNLSMVKGQSMQPTLHERERLFIDKIVYDFKTPSRGEIVVLHDPSNGPDRKEYLVKRVIGVPGDTVEVKNHKLYVNGEPQTEPYTEVEIQDPDFGPLKLDKDHYFVMGDNRHLGASKDSRSFGSVSAKDIVGRAEFIFWPVSQIRGL